MIYIYRRASSAGARELAVALGGKRFRGRTRPITEVVRPNDVVICWGEALVSIQNVKILNGGPIQNKYEDAIKLAAAGVPTITVSRIKPVDAPADPNAGKDVWVEALEAAEDFIEIPFTRNSPVFLQGIKDFSALITKLEKQLAMPLAPTAQWLPRLFNHVGGVDLLNPPVQPDYFSRKENILAEVRIHSFNGKSVRAGQKQPRVGTVQHPWVRSYDGGWSIIYDGFDSTKLQRDLAHKAVKALGLNFGAVDLAQLADGKWIVLEVNRAPGLEGGTITSYASAIQNWMGA